MLTNHQREFRELDVVVIRTLLEPTREITGTHAIMRQPLVGDTGTIVHVYSSEQCIVECVDDSGLTVWVADFYVSEIGHLPSGWTFDVNEISNGVYLAKGYGPGGIHVEVTDFDPTIALAGCHEYALTF